MEKTVIVGLINRNQNSKRCDEYLDELEFLSYTAGGKSSSEIYPED